jgi:hypothetical protein
MTSTLSKVVEKRKEHLKKLQDINYIITWENKRLNTKKKNLDVFLDKKYTICGNIKDIEYELNQIKKETKEKDSKKKEIIKTIIKNKKIYIKNKQTIARLYQLTEMEHNIKNIKYITNTNTNTNTTNFDLKQMSIILPVEVLRHIQEYFTFETRYLLLESKYKPFQLINKFNSYLTREIIKTITVKKYLYLNSGIEDNMIQQYNIFYDCLLSDENNIFKIKRNIKDEKIFLKYIINSFREKYPHVIYDLYKLIILLNKCKIK